MSTFEGMDISAALEQYRHDLEFIRQTAEQVKKDFGLFSLPITFSGNPETAYDELYAQVRPLLEQLDLRQPEKFRALLYQVDIPEADMQAARSLRSADLVYDRITDLVLRRELLKVVLRFHYSGGKR